MMHDTYTQMMHDLMHKTLQLFYNFFKIDLEN